MSARKLTVLLVATLAVGALAVAEDEPDVASLLARHAEARGGAANWAGVKTMKLTGTCQ